MPEFHTSMPCAGELDVCSLQRIHKQYRQCTYNVTRNKVRSRNHCCRGKAISITCFCVCMFVWLSACVCSRERVYGWVDVRALARACARLRVALLILHATCRHIAICSLSGPTTFSTLSHKRHDFRKNIF